MIYRRNYISERLIHNTQPTTTPTTDLKFYGGNTSIKYPLLYMNVGGRENLVCFTDWIGWQTGTILIAYIKYIYGDPSVAK